MENVNLAALLLGFPELKKVETAGNANGKAGDFTSLLLSVLAPVQEGKQEQAEPVKQKEEGEGINRAKDLPLELFNLLSIPSLAPRSQMITEQEGQLLDQVQVQVQEPGQGPILVDAVRQPPTVSPAVLGVRLPGQGQILADTAIPVEDKEPSAGQTSLFHEFPVKPLADLIVLKQESPAVMLKADMPDLKPQIKDSGLSLQFEQPADMQSMKLIKALTDQVAQKQESALVVSKADSGLSLQFKLPEMRSRESIMVQPRMVRVNEVLNLPQIAKEQHQVPQQEKLEMLKATLVANSGEEGLKEKVLIQVKENGPSVQPGEPGEEMASENWETSDQPVAQTRHFSLPEFHRDSEPVQAPADKQQVTRQIIEQIVQKSQVVREQQKTTIEIQLKPEHLGKLEIVLKVENGVLQGEIKVLDSFVRQTIEADLANLKQSLADQGLKLGQLTVSDLQNGIFQQFQQEQRERNSGMFKQFTKRSLRTWLQEELEHSETAAEIKLSQINYRA